MLHHSSPHEKIDPSFGKSVVPVLVPVGSRDRQCEVVIGPQPAHLKRDNKLKTHLGIQQAFSRHFAWVTEGHFAWVTKGFSRVFWVTKGFSRHFAKGFSRVFCRVFWVTKGFSRHFAWVTKGFSRVFWVTKGGVFWVTKGVVFVPFCNNAWTMAWRRVPYPAGSSGGQKQILSWCTWLLGGDTLIHLRNRYIRISTFNHAIGPMPRMR